MPLDGLRKKTRHDKRLDKKVYRASSRINFLVEQQKPGYSPTKKEKEPEIERPEKPKIKTQRQPAFLKTDKQGKKALSKLERPKIKKTAVAKVILVIVLILLISGAMYLSEIVFSSSSTLTSLNRFNPLKQLARLVTSPDKRVEGELGNRINLLVMGVGGPGHEGPYLTDTMIVISIKPSTSEVGLISLPRDMIVQLDSGDWVKVNEVYAIGKATNSNKAGKLTSDVIAKTLDIPIHYYGVISFDGFVEFIDNIGGIMVNVETAFVDEQYPTDDFKTTTVSFEAGPQLMDGETALIFARSRHGTNFEGSDFARSKRQQLILQAVKEKIFKFSTLLSPQKLSSIFKLIDDYIDTNLSIWQSIKIARMVEETTDDKVYRFVLDDSPESLLEPGFTEEGAWILQPKDGNFQAIQRMVNNIFNIGFIKEEAAKIEIQNGTETPGLAFWTMVHLERLGYDVIKYGNALSQDYQKSVIYNISNDKKKETLKWLKEELYAYVAKTVPDYILEDYPYLNSTSTPELTEDYPDFIAILGLNHAEAFKLPEEKPVETATSTEAWATSTDEVLEEEE